jgi:hypothetical protein
MITSIKTLELNLKQFPITISAFDGKKLIKKWEFNNENEAKEAQSEIWKEIFKAKMEEKHGIKTLSA